MEIEEKPEFAHFFLYGLLSLRLRGLKSEASRTMCREIFAREYPEWDALAKVYGAP